VREPKQQDICYATQNRQDAVKLLAPRWMWSIVVGSPTSSNSNRLRELAQRLGTASLHGGQRQTTCRPSGLMAGSRVGLTAGASAPDMLVQACDRAPARLGAAAMRQDWTALKKRCNFPLAHGAWRSRAMAQDSVVSRS